LEIRERCGRSFRKIGTLMRIYQDQELLTPWISGLPNGWKCPRIDDVCEVFFSNVDKHTVEGELPARLCNYVDVYKNEKITHAIDFMEASADAYELKRFQIRKGDVLLTKDSEEPDDIAIASLVDEDLPGVICGYHLALIRTQSRSIKGRFISWVHKSKPFRAQYEAKAVGITRFGLSQYVFRSARIPLPSTEEQDRISTYLDKQCSAIDKVLDSKREQLTVLEDLRKSIIHHAITKGLDKNCELMATGVDSIGKIPVGWAIERIKDVAEIITGNTPPKDDPDNYDNGTFPWIKPDQLRGEIVSSSEEKLSEKGANFARIVPEDAVLIGCIGHVGNFAVSGCPVTTNQQINSLVFCGKVYKPLAKYLVELARDEHKKHATLVVVPILNKNRQGQIYLVIPPLEQQIKINEYLDERVEAIRETRTNIEQQIETLEKYRVSLIHECVTGKRRITEKDLKELANV
jgi:type I restriction enzyme S subunit